MDLDREDSPAYAPTSPVKSIGSGIGSGSGSGIGSSSSSSSGSRQLEQPMLSRELSGEHQICQNLSDGSYSRVHLRCLAPLPIGQSLAVLGNSNSFGGNKKENAVRMYTTPEAYPGNFSSYIRTHIHTYMY